MTFMRDSTSAERNTALGVQNTWHHAWTHKARDIHTYTYLDYILNKIMVSNGWTESISIITLSFETISMNGKQTKEINLKVDDCGTSFHLRVPARCGHICPPRQPVSLMRENIPWRTLNLHTHNTTGLSNPFRSRQGEREWAFEPTEV